LVDLFICAEAFDAEDLIVSLFPNARAFGFRMKVAAPGPACLERVLPRSKLAAGTFCTSPCRISMGREVDEKNVMRIRMDSPSVPP
jgi:hypothetical protein